MKKLILSVIIIVSFITCFQAVYAQFLWNPEGVPVRQGDHIIWQESTARNSLGEPCVVWTDCRDGCRNVYAQKFSVEGIPQWEAGGVRISTLISSPEEAPAVCPAEDGGFIVAWTYMLSDFPVISNSIYLQKVDLNGIPEWGEEGILVNSSSSNNRYYPRLVSDGQSGCIITWQTDYSIITTQRYTSEGTVSPGWPNEGVSVQPIGNIYWGHEMCSDDQGGVIISWSSGIDDEVNAQRISSAGEILWTLPWITVCGADEGQTQVKIVRDGEGGAFLAWADERNQSSTWDDLYAQRIDAEGNALWETNGIEICTEISNQENPRVCSDNAGGIFIAWEDSRNDPMGMEKDIFAQRIDGDGNILWEEDGIEVCIEEEYQNYPEILPDGNEGLFVIWVDGRTGSFQENDIYAQYLSPDGTANWTQTGSAFVLRNGVKDRQSLLPTAQMDFWLSGWTTVIPMEFSTSLSMTKVLCCSLMIKLSKTEYPEASTICLLLTFPMVNT